MMPPIFGDIRRQGDSRLRGNGKGERKRKGGREWKWKAGMGGGRDGNNYFHSGESRNLCGEAAFAEGDHCNVPLRGKFSLSRE